MDTTRNNRPPLGRYAVLFGFLTSLLAAVFFSVLSAPAAHAGGSGGDGGGGTGSGTGGDGCTIVGWDLVYAPSQINIVPGGEGTACGGDSALTPESGLRGEGAAGCWNNRTSVVALWYTVDPTGGWALTNGAPGSPITGDATKQTREHLTSVVNGTSDAALTANVPDRLKADYSAGVIRFLAKSSIARDNWNTVLCVWLDGGGYQCNFLSDWNNYIHVLPGETVFAGPDEARANCYLRCPSASTADYPLKPGQANALIPAAYDTDNKRGNFCWAHSGTEYRNWNRGASYWIPFYWQTQLTGENPHPGPTPWDCSTTLASNQTGQSTACMAIETTPTADLVIPCLNKVRNNPGTDPALCWPTDAQINAANNAPDNHAQVNLNDKQKLFVAEGGVVTVTDRTIRYKVDLNYRTAQRCEWTKSFFYGVDRSRAFTKNNACGQNAGKYEQGWYDAGAEWLQYVSQGQAEATPAVTKAFQFVTNHCNSAQFQAEPAYGSLQDDAPNNGDGLVKNGDSSGYYSASAVSPTRTGANAVNDLPWGPASRHDTNTDKEEFYDRVCSFEGKLANPDTHTAITESNQDSWKFFRDGEWHDVNVDYFVPNDDAASTTVPTLKGYKKTVKTLTSPEKWRLTSQNGTTTTTPVYSTRYRYYVEVDGNWTCKNGTPGVLTGSARCDNANVGANNCTHSGWGGGAYPNRWAGGHPGAGWSYAGVGLWYYEGYANHAPRTEWSDNNCAKFVWRHYYGPVAESYVSGYNTNTTWSNATPVDYTTQAAGNSALASCQANSSKRNCALTKIEAVWNTTTTPLADSCDAGPSGTPNTTGYSETTCEEVWGEEVVVTPNVVEYGEEAPISTHIMRDIDGTPAADKMNMRATNCGVTASTEAFTSNTTAASGPQRNFMANGDEAYSSLTTAILPGCYTQLQARGIWASESGRPQVVAVRWKFTPYISNVAPVTNIGFNGTNGDRTWTRGTVKARIAGMTESVNDTAASRSTFEMKQNMMEHTGTGTLAPGAAGYGGMSKALYYGANKNGPKWMGDPTAFLDQGASDPQRHYLTIEWRRTTTE